MRHEPSGRLAAAVVLLTSGALLLTGIAAAGDDPTEPLLLDGSPAAQALALLAPEQPSASAMPSVSMDGLTRTSAEVAAPAPARAAAEWVDAIARASGIPAPALQGYADATLTLDREDPGCRLGWTTLAGIGAIESGHGTHGGSALDEDGRAFPAIIGPALDGVGFAAIRASELSVALDGDPLWQHAVGPMQFLPDTWERWGADGDVDGREDPQDIDDAALAAGRYLCAGSGDLETADGWHRAVLSYNHDEEYVTAVLARADAYATASRAASTMP